MNKINKVGESYRNIKFTIEREVDNSISFLDIKLTRFNEKIETSVFRKVTHSHRYLNFYSHSSIKNKIGVINNLVYRASKVSSTNDKLEEDINIIRSGLKLNNYPDIFVNKKINDCINKFRNQSNNQRNEIDMSKMIIIPYYRGLSEKISEILNEQEIKVVYRRGKTISNMLACKEKINDLDKCNVVYNINCNDCAHTYTGHTGRALKARVKEHRNALNYSYLNSNVADHAIKFKHDVNFKSPIVKYNERNYHARKFLESWEIEKNKMLSKPLMNDQQNSKCVIPSIYLSLL